MADQDYLREDEGGVLLSVKLQPRASANEILGPANGELRVRVTAPPVDAAANEALVRLLAEVLDCPRGRVELIRGKTTRHKQIRLTGFRADAVRFRLHAVSKNRQ